MSGRRQANAPRSASGPSVTQQVELDEQSLLGNQALTARLHGGPPDDDPVGNRGAALALVERGSLALEIDVIDPSVLARWHGILDASQLDLEVSDRIRGRLDTDAAAARLVHEAVMDCFGEDGPGFRELLARELEDLAATLYGAAPAEGGWQFGGAQVPLAADPEALVVAAAGGGARATAILAFCNGVGFALPEDEEEEAALDPDDLG